MQNLFHLLLLVLPICLTSTPELLEPISVANKEVSSNHLRKNPCSILATPSILSEASLTLGLDFSRTLMGYKLPIGLNIPAIPRFLRDHTFPLGLPPVIADLTLPPIIGDLTFPPGLPPAVVDLTLPPGFPPIIAVLTLPPGLPPIIAHLTLPPGIPPAIADLTFPPQLPSLPGIPPLAPALGPVIKPMLAPILNQPNIFPVSTRLPTTVPTSTSGDGSKGSGGLHGVGQIIGITFGVLLGALCLAAIVYHFSTQSVGTKSVYDEKSASLADADSLRASQVGGGNE